MAQAAGEHPVFDAHLAATRREVASVAPWFRRGENGMPRHPPAPWSRTSPSRCRRSLLLRTAPAAVPHAFVEARLGENRGRLYGELPRGTDVAAILARS